MIRMQRKEKLKEYRVFACVSLQETLKHREQPSGQVK